MEDLHVQGTPTGLSERIREIQAKRDGKRRKGCAFIAWPVFLLIAAFVAFVSYKTVAYYGAIKRGDIVYLPQFRSSFTAARGSSTPTPEVPRNLIESDEAAGTGVDSRDAKLVIVEFGDYECPYTQEAEQAVRAVAATYGDRVRLEFRHYPLADVHVNARDAAVAATCAQEQGKFWEYQDLLFAPGASIAPASLARYAAELGLNEVQFNTCYAEQRYASRVDADTALAQSVGVAGTPTFFFNGVKVEGAVPYAELDKMVQRFVGAQ